MAEQLPQQFRDDLHMIVDRCTGAGSLLDELALIRASIRAYADGMPAEDAVAWASQQISDSISKIATP